MWSGLWRDGGSMVITANGPVFPGRNNPTAKSIFASGKGVIWRCHLLFCVGDSGICRPGEDPGSFSQAHTLTSSLDTGSEEGPASPLISPFHSEAPDHPPLPSPAPCPELPSLPCIPPSCRTPKPTGSAMSLFHNSYITSNVCVAFILCQTVF